MKIETLKEIANDINIVTSDNFVEIMESLPNKNYGRLMNELDRVGDSDTADEYTLWGQRFNGANQNGDIVTVSNDVVEIIFDYVHKETRVFFLNNFEPKWLNWNWILHNVEENSIKDLEINHY